MSKWTVLTTLMSRLLTSVLCSHRIKAVLYPLVRRFEFSLTTPADAVTWSNIPAIRKAYVKGGEDKGPRMPLRIKPYVEV